MAQSCCLSGEAKMLAVRRQVDKVKQNAGGDNSFDGLVYMLSE
jgi:hypothetical protein